MDARDAIAAFADRRHLSERTRRRWLGWEENDGAALLGLAEELLPSENHLREVMDWLEEIEVRDGLRPASVLGEEPLTQRLANRRIGRSDRLKRVKRYIWRRRFPRLAELDSRLRGLAAQSGLREKELSVGFPPGLEGDEIRVELKAGSEEELRGLLERLRRCLADGVFARLFSLLHEAR